MKTRQQVEELWEAIAHSINESPSAYEELLLSTAREKFIDFFCEEETFIDAIRRKDKE